MLKKYVLWRLRRLTKKYFKRHAPKLIVVVGSVGKTGTKVAIATVLGEKYRVRMHEENHNTEFSAPLAMLGVKYPTNPHSMSQWLQVFGAMKKRIKSDSDVDVIVQELGIDAPGDMKHFSQFMHADIAVVTAVTPEHMENMKTMEAVAEEELSVSSFAGLTVINRDTIAPEYAKYVTSSNLTTYGVQPGAEYFLEINSSSPLESKIATLHSPEWGDTSLAIQLVGHHNVQAIAAAAAVCAKLGISQKEFAVGAAKVTPLPGRMQLLRGANGSIIIDDSYNSSPAAAIEALKTLQSSQGAKRIAILGSMNELGEYSEQGHRDVANVCQPSLIDWVVTIGDDAAQYLAPIARQNGCHVKSFKTPFEAGGFVRGVAGERDIILVKGSQNNVFSEEAVKILLHDAEDQKKLVRQSQEWMAKKEQAFDHAPEDEVPIV